MDERTTHEEEETLDIDNELDESLFDDDTTPADTDEESDEPKTAEESKNRQKEAWVKNIKEGKKSLDDMPPNLAWLKKEVKEEVEPTEDVQVDGLDFKIRKALQQERAQEEFDLIAEDLRESDISPEQDAQLRTEYQDLISEFKNPTALQQLKCLNIARKVVGIRDNAEAIMERRRKGRSLPPLGSRKRQTFNKDKETEMEKRLGGNLPPGFKA